MSAALAAFWLVLQVLATAVGGALVLACIAFWLTMQYSIASALERIADALEKKP